MRKVEYSQIVKKKLKELRDQLTAEFGLRTSKRVLKKIMEAVRDLEVLSEKGVSISSRYQIDCDYRYLFIGRTYLFYRIEKEKVIIVEMFNEREDFIYQLFGISTTSQESLDYWDE